MQKVSSLMEDYFSNRPRSKAPEGVIFENRNSDIPVVPKKKAWEHLERPDAMQRLFSFENAKELVFFLEDIIQMQEEMRHHGKMLVDGLEVLVQISTNVVSRVTDLDVEWAAKVDVIYEDIKSARQQ